MATVRRRPQRRQRPAKPDGRGAGPLRRRVRGAGGAHRALTALSGILSAGLPPNQVLERVVAAAVSLAPEAAAHLWLVGESGGDLRLVAEWGFRAGERGVPLQPLLRLGEGLAGAVAKSREPIVVASIAAEPRLKNREWARDQGLVSFAGVPFGHAERLLGTLCLFTLRRHRFTAHQVDLLRAFASQAAVAVENAALLDAAANRLRRLEALREIEREIAQQRDSETLLALIAARASELSRADWAVVYLVDESGRVLRSRASFNVGDWIREIDIPLGQGVVGTAAVRREGMTVNDYPRSTYAITPFRNRIHAVVAQPLVHGEELRGVIAVNRQAPDRPFGPAELSQVADFAVQATIALENARLFAAASSRQEAAETLASISQTLTGSLDLRTVLSRVADGIPRLLDCDGATVGLVETDGSVRVVLAVGLGAERFPGLIVRPGQGLGGRVLEHGEPVWTTDYLHDPEITSDFHQLMRDAGVVGLLAVPVRLQAHVVGVLCALYGRPVEIRPSDLALAADLARVVAIAVGNARLYAEARQREAEARALFEVGHLIGTALDSGRVLDLIVDKVQELMRVRACGIFRLDGQNRLRYARGVRLSPAFVQALAVWVGEGTSGRSVAERAPVWTADILADAELTLNPAARALVEREGYRAVLSVPILIKETPFGCLATYWWEPHVPTPTEVEMLSSLATLAGVALENARLYEDAGRGEADAVALAEASRRFSSTLRREAVVESLAEAAARVVGQSWTVFVVEPLTGALRFVARASSEDAQGQGPGPAAGMAALVSEPLVGHVSATGKALLLGALDRMPVDSALPPEPERRGVGSVLVVPVSTSGAVRGILVGSVHDESQPFTDRHLRLAEAVAERAATALDNARLYEELAQAYEDLKRAQDQLVQTEKLRALGEMASGVAHDFNNTLAVILGRVQLVRSRLEDPTLRRWLEVVERAALDGAQTVQRIQEFTRIRPDQPTEPVDVNQIVRDAVEMTRARWRDEPRSHGLEVTVTTDLGLLPPVDGRPAALRQVLTNLILNAVDALPRGGAISIVTRTYDDRVEIAVTDSGVGMPDEVRRRIFEPFFTTKGSKGTGLGLAMVYGIVARHGGSIGVESKEHVGTTFTIQLPVGRGAPEPAVVSPSPDTGGGKRVLLIDDDELVRETLADALRAARHEVVAAGTGAEGLERLRANEFDLVITDLGMPGMSGWKVAETVKELRPDVAVVLVTGWGIEPSADELRDRGVDRVMNKPIRISDVQAVVASLDVRRPRRS